MKQFVRTLRAQQTDAERLLWRRLRDRQLAGAKFRRQRVIGPYIADFACIEKKLVIEIDGGQHADLSKEDTQRTAMLESRGFEVLRFWNNEVLGQTEAVLSVIQSVLEKPPLTLALSPTNVVEREAVKPPLPLAGEGWGEGPLAGEGG